MDARRLETPTHFVENPSKQNILTSSYFEIVKRIVEFSDPKYEAKSRRIKTFGYVFEEIALCERITTKPETEVQTNVRHVVEYAFRNARLVLGMLLDPSTPDFVSVVFDNKGRLIIDEILDMKTSYNAMNESEGKGQPQKTIDVMTKIIGVVNQIIDGVNIAEIDPQDDLKPKNIKQRNKILREIKAQVGRFTTNGKISFSNQLKYVIVLPEGEDKPLDFESLHNKQITMDSVTVNKEIVHSQFSKRDIHKIIDHYAESEIE